METAVKPVHDGRSRKRRWPAEQKLAVLPEWKNGAQVFHEEDRRPANACDGRHPRKTL